MIKMCCNGVLVIVMLVVSVACAEPCAELAEKACTAGPERAASCRSLRQASERPLAGDRLACQAAKRFVDQLHKGR